MTLNQMVREFQTVLAEPAHFTCDDCGEDTDNARDWGMSRTGSRIHLCDECSENHGQFGVGA